jgi:hypothetical protein
MKRFDIPGLKDALIRKERDGYERGLHFTTFTVAVIDLQGKKTALTKKPVKALFLTYTGLLRVLFVSRNKNAEKFSRWAITKLFTIQMGTKENKEVLVTLLTLLLPKGNLCVIKRLNGSIRVLGRQPSRTTIVY